MIPIRNGGRKGYAREYLNKVLKYFKQILDAVEYYQSFKPPVMHRNLKPENILYDKSNDSFLISDFDFGVGWVYSNSRSLTRTGTILYTSPEQLIEGDNTIAVDYYPLGIMLFEILFPLHKEDDFLEEKLELLRRGDTATACEEMYHSLPQLCCLMTRMVSLVGSRPELNEIVQGINIHSYDMFDDMRYLLTEE